MNICMFTNTYLPHVGGVANSVSRFTKDLCLMGHDVLVIAPTYPRIEALPQDENNVLRVPAIQNFNGSDFSVRIPLPFIIDEKIDEFVPDVIHSHHPYLLGDAAIRAARRRNLPIVFTHHTLYERYTHYVSEDSEVMERFAANLSTEYANLCSHVIAPSESIARLIQRRGVATPVTVVPTGVDIEFFGSGRRNEGRRAHAIPDNAEVVGHVGRLAPEKNIPFLAEAVARYIKNAPNTYFMVVGDGPSKKIISRIFEAAETTKRLILAGKKSGQDLADAYAAMDIFVFASKTETQGMVLTEAMAAGTPVIAIDAAGAREVVDDGKNGRLLPEDASIHSFADAIENFFRHHDTTKQWKKEALDTAKRFDRELCAESLLNIYQALIKKGHVPEADRLEQQLAPWNNLLNAIKAEWDLMAQKAKAVVVTVKEEDPKEPKEKEE
jgi:glycosyltransferase involved in cell wall biosynthesis